MTRRRGCSRSPFPGATARRRRRRCGRPRQAARRVRRWNGTPRHRRCGGRPARPATSRPSFGPRAARPLPRPVPCCAAPVPAQWHPCASATPDTVRQPESGGRDCRPPARERVPNHRAAPACAGTWCARLPGAETAWDEAPGRAATAAFPRRRQEQRARTSRRLASGIGCGASAGSYSQAVAELRGDFAATFSAAGHQRVHVRVRRAPLSQQPLRNRT